MKLMIPVTDRYVNRGKSIVVGVEDDNLIDTLVFDGLPEGEETLFTMVDNAGKYVCYMTGAELPLTSRITASGGKIEAIISVASGEKLWHTRPFVIVVADGLPDAETVEVDPAIEERLVGYTRDAMNAAERAEMAANRAAEVVEGIETYAEEAAQSAEDAAASKTAIDRTIVGFAVDLTAQKAEIAQSVNRAETAKQGAETALQELKDGIANGDFKGEPGKTPVKGVDYFDGKDGKTPVKGVDYTDGRNGQDGVTPIRGVDYWTEQDKQEIISQIPSADPETIKASVDDYLTKHPVDPPSFASDAYFRCIMFGETATMTATWDLTKGNESALTSDLANVPVFTKHGSPVFASNGIRTRWSRAQDWIDLDLAFLSGKDWEINVYTANSAVTSESVKNYDVPVTLIRNGADAPSFIYTPDNTSIDTKQNHIYSTSAVTNYIGENASTQLDRRFRLVKSEKDNTLSVYVYQVNGATETKTIEKIVQNYGTPETLRLCSDMAGYKGCMIPVKKVSITFESIPEG